MPCSLKVFWSCIGYCCKVIFAVLIRFVGSKALVVGRALDVVNYCSTVVSFPLRTILFDEIMCVKGREMMSCCPKGLGNSLFQ